VDKKSDQVLQVQTCLTCPNDSTNINTMKTPTLTNNQIELLDNLMEQIILSTPSEDGICEPNMGDVYEYRQNYLCAQAIAYLELSYLSSYNIA
jgi:hypothetical protein